MQTVAEAQQALKDYIASLDPDKRVKAQQYQDDLEEAASVHKDGMMGVITSELALQTKRLGDAMNGAFEVITEVAANEVLKNHRL